MGKYDPLKEFLSLHRSDDIILTLRQIEIIIGDKLPDSAREFHAWWSDSSSHPNVKSWEETGWNVKVSSLEGEISWVTFSRIKR